MSSSNKAIYLLRIVLIVVAAFIMLFMFTNFSEKIGTPLKDFFTTDFLTQTGAENSVASIYLNYRIYDTIFEALMLLVSVMEVINVSSVDKQSVITFNKNRNSTYTNSKIIYKVIGVIYPFIVLISFYIMFNGHNTPGGGFQGGTILATVLITRYLVYPNLDMNLDLLERAEMIFFACIVFIPILYLFMGIQPENTAISHEIYMVAMNTLISLKVFCGLSVIFYRFVFFEGSEDENARKEN